MPTPKPDRHRKERQLQTNTSEEHRCKNPQQNARKPNAEHIGRVTLCDEVGFIPGFNIGKSSARHHTLKNEGQKPHDHLN